MAALEQSEHRQIGFSQRIEASRIPDVRVPGSSELRTQIPAVGTGTSAAFLVRDTRGYEELPAATHQNVNPTPEPSVVGGVSRKGLQGDSILVVSLVDVKWQPVSRV